MQHSTSFEVVGAGDILLKEDGDVVQTLSPEVYKLFVDEKRSTGRTDIELVPPSIYAFLTSSAVPDISTVAFDRDAWHNRVEKLLPPATTAALFRFQREAIYKMVVVKKCINASSMGIGKSIQGLCALRALRTEGKGDLILCPGYLRDNWANEVRKWLDEPCTVISRADKGHVEEATKTLLYGKGIKVVSYDLAANLFAHMKPAARREAFFNTVVCDESHYLKEAKTKRFRMLQRTIQGASNIFLLSGTPAPNRPVELFAQFSLLHPRIFDDGRVFSTRYCGGYVDQFNHFNDRGSSNIQELSWAMQKLVIRLRREDVLDELPTVTRDAVTLSAPRNHAFGKLMAKFKEELGHLDDDASARLRLQSLASEMFRETARIKESPLLEFLTNFIADNGADGEKVIFFCKHQVVFQAVSSLLRKLDVGYVGISGQTDVKQRPELIRRFLQESSCKYALLTIGSCATGLNLCPVARMLFLELTWSPSDLSQCEARISRIGGAKHLHYSYLLCENTLDDMVFGKLATKNALTKDIVDGGRDYGDFSFANKRPRHK